jgi:tRNA nucleotidyltransferase (CCA-adding enzyme)
MRLIESIKGEYKDLPPERVFEEWRKLLMKSERPSVGLQFLQDSRWIEHFPELAALPGVPQSPKWHPEGDVWEHTKLTVDAAAKLRPYVREEYREPFMFGAMLHDVGKAVPGITVYPEDVKKGGPPLYSAYGHDAAGRPRARSFMESLKAPKKPTKLVEGLVGLHMQPSYLTTGGAGKGAWARLARKVEAEGGDLRLLARIKQADDGGSVPWGERNFPEGIPDWDHPFSETALRWASEFEEAEQSAVKPVVLGRDLIDLGYSPGPNFSTLLKKALALQDSGLEKEEILAVLIQEHPPSSAPSRAPKQSKRKGPPVKEGDAALGESCPKRSQGQSRWRFCRDLRTKYRREHGSYWWEDEKIKAEYKADLREGYKKIKARSR